MKLWAITLNYKKASLELRAKIASQKNALILTLILPWREYCWLFTCHRVELYGVGKENPYELLELLPLSSAERSLFGVLSQENVLRHLFCVVSGLESMVIGENQIMHQVKRAYEEASLNHKIGPVLHRSFQEAFRVSKKVRKETEVGRLAVSLPSLGVKLAEKIVGSLSNKVVAVLGLGEVGRLAAEHFASVQPKKLFLYNRTFSVAERVAQELQWDNISVKPVASLDFLHHETVDVIVSAAEAKLLDENILAHLDDHPLFILDFAVPPSVASYQGRNLYLFSVDDLQKIADENNYLKMKEAEKADRIIQSAVETCWSQLSVIPVSDTFSKLSHKIQILTQDELQQLKSRLSNISEEDWKEIEKMARRLGGKILKDPMIELRERLEENKEPEAWLHFFKSFFRI